MNNQFNQFFKPKLDLNAPCYVPRSMKSDEEKPSTGSSREDSLNPFEKNFFEEKENFKNICGSGIPGVHGILKDLKQEEEEIKLVCEIDEISIDNSSIKKILSSNTFHSKQPRDNSILGSNIVDYSSNLNISNLRLTGTKECVACLERINKKFGLLINCDHVFCYDCIKGWRDENTAQERRELQRQCPICKCESLLIIPSDAFISEKEKKMKIAQENKKKMSNTLCKYIKKGKGECPYGSSCFYLHIKK